jgi:hypothetical protein
MVDLLRRGLYNQFFEGYVRRDMFSDHNSRDTSQPTYFRWDGVGPGRGIFIM